MKKPIITLSLFALLFSNPVLALDIGPFSIIGFAKGEVSYASYQCEDSYSCQLIKDDDRQRGWVDEIDPDKPFDNDFGQFSLLHLYIKTQKFHLGNGFKFSALVSQRWRDVHVYDREGDTPTKWEDIPGIWYDRNISFEHEYYGSLQLGNFPTRGWGLADFPYGSHIGLADAWGASGSGYGINSRAIRYALPILDIFEGDFRFEYTYDFGDADYKIFTPQFHEIWINYIRDGVIFDLIYQYAINGQPGAWSHGPFRGITSEAQYEQKLKDAGVEENKQTMLVLMSHFPVLPTTYLYMGVKHNTWSGMRAVQTKFIPDTDGDGRDNSLWNNMFNVNWHGENGNTVGQGDKGYAASSTDAMFGVRHRWHNKWTANGGVVHLSQAKTDNPIERGQSNSATIIATGLGYQIIPKWSLYGAASFVNYGHKGLAPLQMPAHSSFTGVDSRLTQSGQGFTIGMEYVW